MEINPNLPCYWDEIEREEDESYFWCLVQWNPNFGITKFSFSEKF